jgi:site-specific recombinase
VACQLLSTLVRARIRDRSLRDVARTNVRLLARKIIERAGHTGEHYITKTRREWVAMLGAGAGGGVVMSMTTVLKFLLLHGHLPLFLEGLAASTNYAAGFLVMQLFGFALATKQPSMTAAALAGEIKTRGPGKGDLEPLVTLIARITRSQFAAAISNIFMVGLGALIFDLVYRQVTGHSFLDPETSAKTMLSFSPFRSGTVFYASLTGVMLWLSSICAGWLDNWATYRRLPDAIAQHRLGRIVGRGTMRFIGQRLKHGLAGIGGNVSIGVLLGMTPAIGKFFGLPLEVRHVTLSMASLTLAASEMGLGAVECGLGEALMGIAVILFLNFSVSSVLALWVALRAREVEQGESRLLVAVLHRLWKRPLDFMFPTEK